MFRFLLCSVLFFYVFQSFDSEAYVRTRTNEGIPAFWASLPIDYWIGKKGAKQFGGKAEIDAVHQAFSVWAGVSCGNLSFRFSGLVEKPSAGYDRAVGASNRNEIYWVQSPSKWPFGKKVLAATTLSFTEKTGLIDDVDIRLNDVSIRWFVPGQKIKEAHSVLNTMVHEIGHLLGLDHSSAPNATMFGVAPTGEQKKNDLHKDDIDGICTIYPRHRTLRFSLVEVDSDLRLIPCSKKAVKKQGQGKVKEPLGCQAGQRFSLYDLTIFLLCLFLWASFGLLRKITRGN